MIVDYSTQTLELIPTHIWQPFHVRQPFSLRAFRGIKPVLFIIYNKDMLGDLPDIRHVQ